MIVDYSTHCPVSCISFFFLHLLETCFNYVHAFKHALKKREDNFASFCDTNLNVQRAINWHIIKYQFFLELNEFACLYDV